MFSNTHLPEVLEHKVVRFDISMYDSTLVQGRHYGQYLMAVVEHDALVHESTGAVIGIHKVLTKQNIN